MIKAKLIKAVPTEEGISYHLKGPSDKSALHEAVDLQGEECSIGQAQADDPTIESLDAIVSQIQVLASKLSRYCGEREDEPSPEVKAETARLMEPFDKIIEGIKGEMK